MGNCVYCGKSAGLFHTKHIECEQEYLQRQRILQECRPKAIRDIISSIKAGESLDLLEGKITAIEKRLSLNPLERKSLLQESWEESVEQFLEDGVLDTAEEKHLAAFKDHFALSQEDLDHNGAFTKTAKAAVLRDILNGIIPKRVSMKASVSINFQKDEQVVWAFSDSKYLEDIKKRHYEGGSQGASIRVMKGVYYRVGAFKSFPVDTVERVQVDEGWVVVTTRNIYFAGPQQSLRIPYGKIVSFLPFSDGIGLIRDTATSKLQIFVTGDGWFSYNVVTNLARM